MKFPENKMHAELVRKLYESKIHRTSADSIKTSIMALSILNLFLQTYGIKLMLGTWSQELFDNRDSISDNILNFDRQNFIDLHFPLHRNMTPDFKYNIARDYQHPGPSNNKQFAEYVFNNYSLI